MATQKQYEFFKWLYGEETERADELHEHAKNNLALATLYSAFILFVIEKLRPETIASKAFFIATVVCMLVAFLLSLWATQISEYEAVADPADIFAEYTDRPPTDEEFYDDRIVDFSVACERNIAVNDTKANQLMIGRYFLLLGITLHACYFVLRMS